MKYDVIFYIKQIFLQLEKVNERINLNEYELIYFLTVKGEMKILVRLLFFFVPADMRSADCIIIGLISIWLK